MSSQAEEDGCRACRWREANPRYVSTLSNWVISTDFDYLKMFWKISDSIIDRIFNTFQIIRLSV